VDPSGEILYWIYKQQEYLNHRSFNKGNVMFSQASKYSFTKLTDRDLLLKPEILDIFNHPSVNVLENQLKDLFCSFTVWGNVIISHDAFFESVDMVPRTSTRNLNSSETVNYNGKEICSM
jgi:hypothetical protein